MQSHGGREPAVQGAVDEERQKAVPVHPGPGAAVHQPHDTRGQNRREYSIRQRRLRGTRSEYIIYCNRRYHYNQPSA